ncbi:hypothetical protein Tsubulata_042223 [Turnera subulata]|uniref:RRM domain-containing protein n=1 Tax=Turnera subulata TaxID=218843 RepID=A0A9Q0GBC5_9ROSI|nr:hypothetical protein Tsubulata_042223 [Turnera subulata]
MVRTSPMSPGLLPKHPPAALVPGQSSRDPFSFPPTPTHPPRSFPSPTSSSYLTPSFQRSTLPHSHPFQNTKPSYFSKWSRNQIQKAIDNREISSFYVENLPTNWTAVDVHMTVAKFSDVYDVFIPSKRSKKGNRFCFIRVKPYPDSKSILTNINHIQSPNGLLRAFIAKNRNITYKSSLFHTPKPTLSPPINPTKSNKPFADAVSGSSTESKTPKIWWTTYRRGPRVMKMLLSFQNLKSVNGSTDVLLPLAANPSTNSTSTTCFCLMASTGFQELFNLLSAFMGKLSDLSPETESRSRLDRAFLHILTTLCHPIDRSFSVTINNTVHHITLQEIPPNHPTLPSSQPVNSFPSTSDFNLINLDPESHRPASISPVFGNLSASDTRAELLKAPADQDPFGLTEIIEKPNMSAVPPHTHICRHGPRPSMHITPLFSPNSPIISPQNFNSQPLCSHAHKIQMQPPTLFQNGASTSHPITPYQSSLPTSPSSEPSVLDSSRTPSLSLSYPLLNPNFINNLIERRINLPLKNNKAFKQKKTKRITTNGSATSSISDHHIRCANKRLVFFSHPPPSPIPFAELEVDQTINVGTALGWRMPNDDSAVRRLTTSLVENEVVAWNRSLAEDDA